MKTSVLIAALAAAACTSAPKSPTWQGDVMPIVASNCIRCHGSPAAFGAPPTFRLDVYRDTLDPVTGEHIAGAGAMAAFASTRVHDDAAPMPPVFPLIGDAKDVFNNWGGPLVTVDPFLGHPAQPAALGDPRPNNHKPTIGLVGVGNDDYDYEIDDADSDLVYGELYEGGTLVASNLHAGRGRIHIDTSLMPAGSHTLTPKLDDGDPVDGDPITIDVAHFGGAPPSIKFVAPSAWQIITGATFDVQLNLDALDPGPLTLELRLIDPIHTGTLATDIGVPPGDHRGAATVTWDLGSVPDGEWVIEATARDNQGHHTTITSQRFRVSSKTTPLTFADTRPIFDSACSGCHGFCPTVPGLSHDWLKYTVAQTSNFPAPPPNRGDACKFIDPPSGGPLDGVGDNVGLIYEHVVVRKDMPPVSTQQTPLADADREMLATWLLAGAPCGGAALCQ